jgi:hypothetical protein
MSIYHVIVDKYYVLASDVSVLKDVILTRPASLRRGRRPSIKGWLATDRTKRHAFLRGVLEAHHENRALYLAVVGGII